MNTTNIRVVIFKDDSAWVAHCVEHDIAVQAPDVATLKRRLQVTLELDLSMSMKRHGTPFGGIGRAPQCIEAMWDSALTGLKDSSKAQSDGQRPAMVDYEMALVA